MEYNGEYFPFIPPERQIPLFPENKPTLLKEISEHKQLRYDGFKLVILAYSRKHCRVYLNFVIIFVSQM